jgi:hypothetical protein
MNPTRKAGIQTRKQKIKQQKRKSISFSNFFILANSTTISQVLKLVQTIVIFDSSYFPLCTISTLAQLVDFQDSWSILTE